MTRLYLDEDVSVLLAEILRRRGVDAITARDEQMLGKTDEQNLQRASSQSRVMVTHNRVDFEKLFTLYTEQNLRHAGIIVLSRKRDIYTIAHRLILFLNQHKEIQNQLWYL